MDSLIESALDAAALRYDIFRDQADKRLELLTAMTEWHQQNEDAVLPTALLAMLVAAREVC